MYITSLRVEDLRILEKLYMEPCPGMNFIVGDNGAGKTSVLEAIYLAGRGRTFRHSDAGPMIRKGRIATTVVIESFDESTGRRSTLGLQRENKNLLCRLDGRDITRRSDLAEALPVQWIGSQPQLLLSMGPEVRRKFIDMGLFHVEQLYLSVLGEFLRTLRQRNAAIRQNSGADSVRLWNRPLAVVSERLHEYRVAFITTLMTKTRGLLAGWNTGYELDYRYRPGWSEGEPLLRQLDAKLEMDLRLGFTGRGPQRAELELITDGGLADKKLSRGQQKILVLALNLAMIDLLADAGRKLPVVLVDDLAAELDRENRSRIIEELSERKVQSFLTQIEPGALAATTTGIPVQRFHVEHGAIVN